MYERHTNRERYFQEQVFTTEKHVIPYIQEVMKLTPDLVVAEIGCGEGGNLKPFLDLGCKVIGIDLSESKIANGEVFFAEHQQICLSKFLTNLPYFHILPVFMYRGILKLFGESEATIENLLEVKSTGLSIARFRKIVSKRNYQFDRETLYFINPNYEVKFKLKTRKLWPVFNLPFLRDFFTTTHYSVISVKGND